MRVTNRIFIVALAALVFMAPAVSWSDEAEPAADVVVPPPRKEPAPPPAAEPPPPKPVAAVPPAFVELATNSIAAGIGFSWGDGTLTYEGRAYEFDIKGVSLVDLGASSAVSMGEVYNLENLEDFEGSYLAVEAAGAAGAGSSALTMRNENGVVITLHSELQGVQLALATRGLRISLK